MIPLHQLPMARWRKIMRTDQLVSAQELLDKLNDSAQAKQMAAAGWDLHQMKTECERSLSSWQNWKAAEAIRLKRQRWIYGFVTATVLGLIGFLVMGGCR
jgi:hypothetical protein